MKMRIYIIQNADGVPIAAAIDEQKAIEMCNDNKDKRWYYSELPLYKSDYIEINLVNNKVIKIKPQ